MRTIEQLLSLERYVVSLAGVNPAHAEYITTYEDCKFVLDKCYITMEYASDEVERIYNDNSILEILETHPMYGTDDIGTITKTIIDTDDGEEEEFVCPWY